MPITARFASAGALQISDFYILDGSFLRISNITLGYTFRRISNNKLKISNARFYVSGQNLFTITKYPGYDPEIGAGGGNPLSNGVDAGIYPMSRMFSFGFNLTF